MLPDRRAIGKSLSELPVKRHGQRSTPARPGVPSWSGAGPMFRGVITATWVLQISGCNGINSWVVSHGVPGQAFTRLNLPDPTPRHILIARS